MIAVWSGRRQRGKARELRAGNIESSDSRLRRVVGAGALLDAEASHARVPHRELVHDRRTERVSLRHSGGLMPQIRGSRAVIRTRAGRINIRLQERERGPQSIGIAEVVVHADVELIVVTDCVAGVHERALRGIRQRI